MGKERLKAIYLILVISAIMILAGCGGGGGGGGSSSSSGSSGSGSGSGTGLSVAEEVSVVEAQESASKVKAMKIGKIFLAPEDVPANSDYNNDMQEIYVHERSAEGFGIINEILCAMGQSKYDEMVNMGNYKAQIDMNQCSQDKDNASSAGEASQNQSSGSTAPDYEMWTLNSSRADNNSPHIVKVWIHEEADKDMPASVIFVKVTITEGVSDTNPYGMFSIYFKGHEVGEGGVVDTTAEPAFKGYLKTELSNEGKVLLNFVEQEGVDGEGIPYGIQVVLNREADGSGGSGSIYAYNEWDGEHNFDIAFNTTRFLRNDGTTSMCFNRTDFEETAWDYGLYNSNGARVNRNSGFSIKTGEYYGWIGYYGLWLPEEASVGNGDTVYKVTYGQGGETAVPYTVVKKGGRLKKHTRGLTSLNKIKNVPLNYWTPDGNFNVKWDGAAFVKFARQNQVSYMWEEMEDGDPDKGPLNLADFNYGDLNFWSQSLGGQVRVKLAGCIWDSQQMKLTSCVYPDPAAEQVVFYKEDVVFPGDTVPSTLTCYDNCPKYSEADGGISGVDPMWPMDGMTAHAYSFSTTADEMILREGGNPLVWVGTAGGQYEFGSMSGPLFNAADPANISALDCNWDGDSDPTTNEQMCGWKAHGELSAFYTWETGPNQWNQFTALKDGEGNVLEFQPPLQIEYTHLQTDETAYDYKYNGVNLYLEYSGFGNLHGIPGTCIDMDTGEPVNCGPGTRWVPEFTIPDGSEATDGTNDYLIKALRKEQRMGKLDLDLYPEACSGLSVTSYDLPTIDGDDGWVDPNIGSEPVVTNAPAVVGGVIQ